MTPPATAPTGPAMDPTTAPATAPESADASRRAWACLGTTVSLLVLGVLVLMNPRTARTGPDEEMSDVVEFVANEYHPDGSLQGARFRFEGSLDTGWTTFRNDAPHVELGPGYRLTRSVMCG